MTNPQHYLAGRKYEPIEVALDWRLDPLSFNVLKYISRAGRKGPRLEDLRKARFYLDRLIQEVDSPTSRL